MKDLLNTDTVVSRVYCGSCKQRHLLEASVEQVDAKDTIGKEECSAQRLHAFDLEEIKRQ